MKKWQKYAVVVFAFLFGFEWASYIAHKDVSQFGTQLQCTNQQGEQ